MSEQARAFYENNAIDKQIPIRAVDPFFWMQSYSDSVNAETLKKNEELVAEVGRLRAEINRVAPFLAIHGFDGYRFKETIASNTATPEALKETKQ